MSVVSSDQRHTAHAIIELIQGGALDECVHEIERVAGERIVQLEDVTPDE